MEMERPYAFLAALRRRRLSMAFVGLCLPAALLNETYRWGAFYANRLFGLEIPFLNIGPYFLLAAFVYTVRRWSLQHAAADADHRLDFRDRLASYLDFGSRDDLPGDVKRAQAGEVAQRLKGVQASRLAPLRLRSALGPPLLTASLLYPLFFFTPGQPLSFRSPTIRPSAESIGVVVSEEGATALAPPPTETPEGSGGEKGMHGTGSGKSQAAADPRGGAGPLEGLESQADGGSGETGREGGSAASPAKERAVATEEENSDFNTSKRSGLGLSPVVDPVFSGSSGEGTRKTELAGGTMSFRLLPKTSGENRAGGEAAALAPALRVDVDFESIPERYRNIVRKYFTDLERNMTKGSL